jgi:cytochrome c553
MKRIILSILLASITLFAADSDSVYKSGVLLEPKGDVIYKKQCASCHGDDGKQTSFKGSARNIKYAPIAGWMVAKMKQELKEYRGGIANKDYSPVNKTGYGALMRSATKDLSWDELDAVAEYINSLK